MIFLLFALNSYASESMRKCMLLPVTESLQGGVGFKIFEGVEEYLKRSEWCYYRTNSEILNILSNYKKNLDSHLKNPEVLKILAEKSHSGSLIKVDVNFINKTSDVSLTILGDNGEEIYFQEKIHLTNDNLELITRTLINWLEIYKTKIPYDGRITGILGDQFTLDFGKEYRLSSNDQVEILRPVQMVKHPFLKKVVDWKMESIAKGQIFFVTDGQSQGRFEKIFSKKAPRIGDWVLIKKEKETFSEKKVDYSETSDSFGKLGTLALGASVGTGSSTVNSTTTDPKKMGGLVFGVAGDFNLWITRNYWLGVALAKKFGVYKKELGTLSAESNSVGLTDLKISFAYRYLPLGFFYGPQVDILVGYAKFAYGLDPQVADKMGPTAFSGLFLGVEGNIPILRKIRGFLGLEFLLSPKYSENVLILGNKESASHYGLKFGGSYLYEKNMLIDGYLSFKSSSGSFSSAQITSSQKETAAYVAVKFVF